MIRLLLFLLIFCVAADLKAPLKGLKGVPVPKAEVLDELLSKFMDKSDYTGAVFNYLKGQSPNSHEDNLDIAVLDVDNVRKLINKAKNKYQHVFRRKSEAYQINQPESEFIINTAMDLMRQSIYATRYRLEATKHYRKLFENNVPFNIAIFYGALMQVNLKIEALYSSMRKLSYDTHFLWYLIIYEKILAANVDAHDMVERIFYLHDLYLKDLLGGQAIVIAPTIPLPLASTRRPRRPRTRTTTTQRTRADYNDADGADEDAASGNSTTPQEEDPEEKGPPGEHDPPEESTSPHNTTFAPPENTEAENKTDQVSDDPKEADVGEGATEVPTAPAGEPTDPTTPAGEPTDPTTPAGEPADPAANA